MAMTISQPKDSSGNFEAGFDTISWKTSLTEASPWQYCFDVPHDVNGLDQLFEGNLCGKIGEIMQKTSGEYIHLGNHRQVIISCVRRGLPTRIPACMPTASAPRGSSRSGWSGPGLLPVL